MFFKALPRSCLTVNRLSGPPALVFASVENASCESCQSVTQPLPLNSLSAFLTGQYFPDPVGKRTDLVWKKLNFKTSAMLSDEKSPHVSFVLFCLVWFFVFCFILFCFRFFFSLVLLTDWTPLARMLLLISSPWEGYIVCYKQFPLCLVDFHKWVPHTSKAAWKDTCWTCLCFY